MPENIIKIHDKVLTFLLNWRKKNPDFTFALRKSDFSKKLSTGHWFYGTDELLILSFWSGMDWKGKVPNISFCYNLKDEESYLQFSARDSEEKQQLISNIFESQFQFEFSQDAFYFKRSPFVTHKNLLKNLESFLKTDKLEIDKIVSKNKKDFETKQNPRNRIGFISEKEFKTNLRKTLKHRLVVGSNILPISLTEIEIKDFGPIKHIQISEIPKDAQWIFLTGENGTGKTTILKAMATAFTKGTLGLGPRTSIRSKYNITLTLNKFGRNPHYRIKKSNSTLKELNILTDGFVAFGPVRLNIANDEINREERVSISEKLFKLPHIQLFRTNGFLLDIGTVFNSHNEMNKLIRGNDEKMGYIIEAITRICESIVDVHFGRGVRYFERDKNNQPFHENGTSFRDLASGYKSIIAMISHMMLHLFYQQPKVNDPSELKGIVIIDEIDLHFHPKMQRDLVIKLTEIFPQVQFIVSTHSPIPLLGAPKNSVVFTVKRDAEIGVYVERMDGIVEFENLLPNSILTSPIFNLQEIIPESHSQDQLLKTDDQFSDVLFYEMLDEKLNHLKKKYRK